MQEKKEYNNSLNKFLWISGLFLIAFLVERFVNHPVEYIPKNDY